MNYWKIFLFIFFFTACRSGGTKIKQEELVQGNVENSIFDGKTLTGWEVTNFGTQGPVQVTDGKIVLSYGDGCTGINYTRDFPTVNYEVRMNAMRVSGNDFFCGITFPVNETFCSFIVGGWGGPVVGLSTIDGLDTSENVTKVLMNFEKNTWYKIRLKVTRTKIEAWINEENVLDFEIGEHKLYIRPEVTLSKPFGICTWNTTGAIRDIKLEYL